MFDTFKGETAQVIVFTTILWYGVCLILKVIHDLHDPHNATLLVASRVEYG
jgi:hypothetical protein